MNQKKVSKCKIEHMYRTEGKIKTKIMCRGQADSCERGSQYQQSAKRSKPQCWNDRERNTQLSEETKTNGQTKCMIK